MTEYEPTPSNVGADAPPRSWIVLDTNQRMARVLFATAGAALVLIAYLLTPDARGVGTHEQLGLPPCFTFTTLHIPCPFCGMTTAFSLMAHGRIFHALATQPAGAIGFAATVGLVVLAVASACAGLAPAKSVTERLTRRCLTASAVILFLAWVYKVATVFANT